jgi:hypothetical protein
MFRVAGYKPGTVIDFEIQKSAGCARPLAIAWALAYWELPGAIE